VVLVKVISRVLVTFLAPLCAVAVATGPAEAEAYHNSTMAQPYCLSVPYVPGDCTGFIVGRAVTVEMVCWNTGPLALGTRKWFEITVLSGSGYGATGEVPANAVGDQWKSSPEC
jgi:hypothetical protein